MNKNISGWIMVAFAALSMIVTAAIQWGRLESRVTALESEQHYLHGEVTVPKGQ